MIEPLISERRIEFDGHDIGSVRRSGERWIAETDDRMRVVCDGYDEAVAKLVERWAMKQEGEHA